MNESFCKEPLFITQGTNGMKLVKEDEADIVVAQMRS